MKKTTVFLFACFSLLLITGCHKDSDDSTGPGDTGATYDPLKPDQTDVELSTYPGTISFEDVSNSGPWAVAIFPATGPGRIISVVINNEAAVAAKPHNGRPVYRLSKTGDKYARPLKFNITTTIGKFVYSTAPRPVTPGTPPVGTQGKSETQSGPVYANGDRAHFRFPRLASFYGDFKVKFSNGDTYSVTRANMSDGRHEPGGGVLVKSPDNRNGTAILGKFHVKYTTCRIDY